MKSVIVVLLALGLVAAQYMQKEPAIQVVQVKAAITEVQVEVTPMIEEEKKAESQVEAKVQEVTEAENPFARPADIKNSKPPMTYEQIFQEGEVDPEVKMNRFSSNKPPSSREKSTKEAILATRTKNPQEPMATNPKKKTWDSIAT